MRASLRRDPAYVAWYAKASDATRGAAGDGRQPGDNPIQWGVHFAEHPEAEAPEARIIWHASLDPGALPVVAAPIDAADRDAIDVASLAPWLAGVTDDAGEHVVLSDGRHHIRLDIERGTLIGGHPVRLHYQLAGIASVGPKILPLRRLLDLCRHRRFLKSLYPPDPRVDRWILALRVHDAVVAGASQREIAHVLFGKDAFLMAAVDRSDSLRSRVRRLVADARILAGGGYRALMKQRD